MPFFSSEERAQQFLAGKSWGDTSFFQPYRLLAGFVATPENDMFDLLFDAGFSTARRLSHEERLLLRALSTAG